MYGDCHQLIIAMQSDAMIDSERGLENGNLHWPRSGGLSWPHPVMVDVSV
jgi:hypothetical protein